MLKWGGGGNPSAPPPPLYTFPCMGYHSLYQWNLIDIRDSVLCTYKLVTTVGDLFQAFYKWIVFYFLSF